MEAGRWKGREARVGRGWRKSASASVRDHPRVAQPACPHVLLSLPDSVSLSSTRPDAARGQRQGHHAPAIAAVH